MGFFCFLITAFIIFFTAMGILKVLQAILPLLIIALLFFAFFSKKKCNSSERYDYAVAQFHKQCKGRIALISLTETTAHLKENIAKAFYNSSTEGVILLIEGNGIAPGIGSALLADLAEYKKKSTKPIGVYTERKAFHGTSYLAMHGTFWGASPEAQIGECALWRKDEATTTNSSTVDEKYIPLQHHRMRAQEAYEKNIIDFVGGREAIKSYVAKLLAIDEDAISLWPEGYSFKEHCLFSLEASIQFIKNFFDYAP